MLLLEKDLSTVIMTTPHELDLALVNRIHYDDNAGSARIVTRGLRLDLFDSSVHPNRNEFQIRELSGDELYVKSTYWLPGGFETGSFFQIANPVTEWLYEQHRDRLMFGINLYEKPWRMKLSRRFFKSGKRVQYGLKNISVNLSAENTLEYWVKRHESNGAIKVWWNGNLIFDISGIQTKVTDLYMTYPAKCYSDQKPNLNAMIVLSRLEIHDSMPEEEEAPPPAPPEPPPPACIVAFLLSGVGGGGLLPWIRLLRSHLPLLMINNYYLVSDMLLRLLKVK